MLRDQLEMLADSAPDYTDAEQALREHGARRRRRIAVGLSAAAVLVISAFIAYPRPSPPPVERDPVWTVPAAPSYPPEIRLGAESVPALPLGKVGPALLAAQTSAREQCAPACPQAVLVMVGGEQYALPDGGRDWSLSPDGRWLVGTFGRSYYALRDLTADDPPRSLGTDADSSNRWQPVAWSPDSRWLLLWRPGTGDVCEYQRVEVATGRTVAGTLAKGERLLAVLASGDLLTGPTAATVLGRTEPVALRILDPAGPAERRRVTLKDTVLAADRIVVDGAPAPALLTPDGRGVVLTLASLGNRAVLAAVDLRTGDLITGQLLPDGWRPVSVTGRGIIATTTRQDGQQPFDTVIGVIEPNAAEPTVLVRVIRGGSVLLRGGYTWA